MTGYSIAGLEEDEEVFDVRQKRPSSVAWNSETPKGVLDALIKAAVTEYEEKTGGIVENLLYRGDEKRIEVISI